MIKILFLNDETIFIVGSFSGEVGGIVESIIFGLGNSGEITSFNVKSNKQWIEIPVHNVKYYGGDRDV